MRSDRIWLLGWLVAALGSTATPTEAQHTDPQLVVRYHVIAANGDRVRFQVHFDGSAYHAVSPPNGSGRAGSQVNGRLTPRELTRLRRAFERARFCDLPERSSGGERDVILYFNHEPGRGCTRRMSEAEWRRDPAARAVLEAVLAAIERLRQPS